MKLQWMAILVLTPVLSGLCHADTHADLAKWFAQPPANTRPWCYWYWISGNVSRDGIDKDIAAMAHVGIGQAMIGSIEQRGHQGNVKVLTPQWFDLAAHAMREGKKLGVKIGMFNCPGWSQTGGPWVKPTEAMRYVVSSEVHVKGPMQFSRKLAVPKQPFQDIAVLAYPEPADDTNTLASHKPTISCSAAVPDLGNLIDGRDDTDAILLAKPKNAADDVIDLTVTKPFTARSLAIVPGPKRFSMKCQLLAFDHAGKAVVVKTFSADRKKASLNVGPMPLGPVLVAFPAVTATHFQLRIMAPNPGGAREDADIAELRLRAAPRVGRYIEKQLGKLYPAPHPNWGTYMWPPQAEPNSAGLVTKPSGIVNLTANLKPDGTLNWAVPAGNWIITRIGMTPTGVTNSPAPKEGTGLEMDKMNRTYLPSHYDAYVQKVMQRLSPSEQKSVGHIIADSYEVGSENWTDGFDKVFKNRYGYDPIPWLPVLTGRIIGSATQSNRFLWDLRRLIADRIATEYVGGMADLLASHGHQLWLEKALRESR